jgi:hypothetical protein
MKLEEPERMEIDFEYDSRVRLSRPGCKLDQWHATRTYGK